MRRRHKPALGSIVTNLYVAHSYEFLDVLLCCVPAALQLLSCGVLELISVVVRGTVSSPNMRFNYGMSGNLAFLVRWNYRLILCLLLLLQRRSRYTYIRIMPLTKTMETGYGEAEDWRPRVGNGQVGVRGVRGSGKAPGTTD